MSGGPNGARVYWPAGLEDLVPAARAAALARGEWGDGDYVITISGDRRYDPLTALKMRKADAA